MSPLAELAMAVCMVFINLPCHEIRVSDTELLAERVNGLTRLYSSGRVEIRLKPNYLADHGVRRTRALLVHEFAHAITYLQGATKRGHSPRFRKNCKAVARKVRTPVRECYR